MRAIQTHVNTIETLMRFAPLVPAVNANGTTDVVNSEAKIFEIASCPLCKGGPSQDLPARQNHGLLLLRFQAWS
jgi:hypothetical protein